MVEVNKKTKKEETLIKESTDELKSESPTQKVVDGIACTNDMLKYVAERFNAMRAQLSDCCELIKNQDSDALKYAVMAKSIAQGDYGLLLDEETSTPSTMTVEESALFTKNLEEVARTKRYDTRIGACLRLRKLLFEAVERLRTKSDKMKERASGSGSSVAELDTVAKKTIQFDEAIVILKKRSALVSEIYFSTRKQLQAFIDKSNDEFYSYTIEEDAHDNIA